MAAIFATELVLIADETGMDGLQIADGNAVRVRIRARRRVMSITPLMALQPTIDITPDVDCALVA